MEQHIGTGEPPQRLTQRVRDSLGLAGEICKFAENLSGLGTCLAGELTGVTDGHHGKHDRQGANRCRDRTSGLPGDFQDCHGREE